MLAPTAERARFGVALPAPSSLSKRSAKRRARAAKRSRSRSRRGARRDDGEPGKGGTDDEGGAPPAGETDGDETDGDHAALVAHAGGQPHRAASKGRGKAGRGRPRAIDEAIARKVQSRLKAAAYGTTPRVLFGRYDRSGDGCLDAGEP